MCWQMFVIVEEVWELGARKCVLSEVLYQLWARLNSRASELIGAASMTGSMS